MATQLTGVPLDKVPPKFPSIPVPAADVDSLNRTCLALKQVADTLTGLDASSKTGDSADRFAPHVFTQPSTPTALHEGDLWLCTGSTFTFNIWSGGKWLVIATLPNVP